MQIAKAIMVPKPERLSDEKIEGYLEYYRRSLRYKMDTQFVKTKEMISLLDEVRELRKKHEPIEK